MFETNTHLSCTVNERFLIQLKPYECCTISKIRSECALKECEIFCNQQKPFLSQLKNFMKKLFFMKTTCPQVKKEIDTTFPRISYFLIKERLISLGMIPGKKITMIGKSPLNDPIIIDVSGQIVSLRKIEADFILVKASEE